MGSYIYAHSSEESMSDNEEEDSANNRVYDKPADIEHEKDLEIDVELREHLMRSFPGM